MAKNTSGLRRGGPGRPKGLPNKIGREQREFLKSVLESEEYRESLRRRLIRGDTQLEVMAHHYLIGKPKDTLAIEKMPPMLVVDELSDQDVVDARTERDDA
jgi:hypothetical protein